jgi:rhodanese-related sulfurtransferase
MFLRKIAAALAVVGAVGTSLAAQTNARALNNGALDIAFVFNGTNHSFDQSTVLDVAQITSHFRPGSDCAGPCLAPDTAADGVQTIGERGVINFVANQVASGAGLLIDSRTAADRSSGFITASVNIPTALLQPENTFLTDILQAMGAQFLDGSLTFSDALPVVIFDDGPSTTDAHALITTLINLGYPAKKISYYRGGMLVWTALGLNTQDAKS